MSERRRRLGARGEAIARSYLSARGYVVSGANVRTAGGEIDLVAAKDGEVVFVEVRARAGRALGTPEESITAAKRARLIALAQEYIQRHGLEGQRWRIDLVAIEGPLECGTPRINHIENAVEG